MYINGEARIGYVRYLLMKINEHKFSFRWVKREKIRGHPR